VEFKLKSISPAGIPEAISKAELYRSLNEPEEAESICHDILAVEPEHQIAIRILGLAITDQFCGDASDRVTEAHELFKRLAERYEQLYYTGLMHERRAKAQMRLGRAGPAFWRGDAMLRGGGNDSARGKRRCHSSLESLRQAAAKPSRLRGRAAIRSIRRF
jgi:hypothetical protein